MDFACPACGVSLAANIPRSPSGSSKFWQGKARERICPSCACPLQFNTHPLERIVHGALLIYLCALALVNYWVGDVRILLAGGCLALLGEFAWQGWAGHQLRSWPRYLLSRQKGMSG